MEINTSRMLQTNKTKSNSLSKLTKTQNKFFKQNAIKPLSRMLSSSQLSISRLTTTHNNNNNCNNQMQKNYQSARQYSHSHSHSQKMHQKYELDNSKVGAYRMSNNSSGIYHTYNSNNNNNNSNLHQMQRMMKLNPKQFQHRQVFNTKIYKQGGGGGGGTGQPGGLHMKKFFNIKIDKKQRQQAQLGDQVGQYFKQISKNLQSNNYHNNQSLKKQWQSITHYTVLLQTQTSFIPKQNPIKLILTNLFPLLQKLFISLSLNISSSVQILKQKQMAMLAQTSSSAFNHFHSQHEVGGVGDGGNKSKRLLSVQLGQRKRNDNDVVQQNIKNIKNNEDTYQQNYNTKTLINKLKAKISILDFQNKKQTLKIQSLQSQLTQKHKQIQKLINKNKQMQIQIQSIDKVKQDYDYKIRKYKEELEVAHIVKQQNMEDKINYILGWKL